MKSDKSTGLTRREYEAAVKRGEERRRTEIRATAARYDRKEKRLVLDLNNGATLIVPVRLLQELDGAPERALLTVELGPRGASIHWEDLDVDFGVHNLALGIFGGRSWMSELGRKGGKSTSKAKQAAARANGAKGGRPKNKAA